MTKKRWESIERAKRRELTGNNVDDHTEPTYANQLRHARKLLREKGHNALDNPHGMIGRTCGCGTCFCCAAAEVLSGIHLSPNGDGLGLGYYDLWIGDVRHLRAESFAVCDQVRESLLSGQYHGETGEVAQRIADAAKES